MLLPNEWIENSIETYIYQTHHKVPDYLLGSIGSRNCRYDCIAFYLCRYLCARQWSSKADY